jgi:hypothetical protein
MKADKTAPEDDLSSIPGEFRENYRFLSELINCKHKNDSLTDGLESLVDQRLSQIRGQLNKRQLKVLNQFIEYANTSDQEAVAPPVPVELEAAIRIKKRAVWLPWEAEAIRKIERWRNDLHCITTIWNSDPMPKPLQLPTKIDFLRKVR